MHNPLSYAVVGLSGHRPERLSRFTKVGVSGALRFVLLPPVALAQMKVPSLTVLFLLMIHLRATSAAQGYPSDCSVPDNSYYQACNYSN